MKIDEPLLVMSGDTVTAQWNNGELTVLNSKLLPLYLSHISNVDMWLSTRAIDAHRANSRLLKKALRLTERDDISTVIHVNGATITDNYWVKPVGSALTYGDIKFTDDYFSVLALRGTYDSFNNAAISKRSRTPELTNTGSFEKCWKLYDGKWYMLKSANNNELFSELFISIFGTALGMNMALYEKGDGFIKTLDFTENAAVNFEPAAAFMGDNDDYEDVINALLKICPGAVKDYIKMIFLDTITANPDRHTNNFGLLRDTNTGELLGLAPNFDNNMALISRGYPSNTTAGDLLITLFNDVLKNHPEFAEYIPDINDDIIKDCIRKTQMDVDADSIIKIIMSRYGYVRK